MTTLTARFPANRAVRQYTTEFYLPAAAAYEARRAQQSALGIRLVNWRQQIEQGWQAISFGDLKIETRNGEHHFRVEVILGKVDPEAVQVELFTEEPEGGTWRQPMVRGGTSCRIGREVTALPPKCRRRARRGISPPASSLALPGSRCRWKCP
jgi:starch phosphorylase